MQADSFPLWPDHTPGAAGDSANDIPTLASCFPPSGQANGASMLILMKKAATVSDLAKARRLGLTNAFIGSANAASRVQALIR